VKKALPWLALGLAVWFVFLRKPKTATASVPAYGSPFSLPDSGVRTSFSGGGASATGAKPSTGFASIFGGGGGGGVSGSLNLGDLLKSVVGAGKGIASGVSSIFKGSGKTITDTGSSSGGTPGDYGGELNSPASQLGLYVDEMTYTGDSSFGSGYSGSDFGGASWDYAGGDAVAGDYGGEMTSAPAPVEQPVYMDYNGPTDSWGEPM
jgi:hypothetical protein